jgi:hypothetical protein
MTVSSIAAALNYNSIFISIPCNRRECGRGKLKESRGSNCTTLRCNFNLPSTLHSNVSLIAGIATDGFVAVLRARLRVAGGGGRN